MGPLVAVTLSVERLLGVSRAAEEDRTRSGGEPGEVAAGNKSSETISQHAAPAARGTFLKEQVNSLGNVLICCLHEG